MPGELEDTIASAPLVILDGVTRTFSGDHLTRAVIAPLSLSVFPGEVFCILGESGCGKSTLLNLIAGIDQPTTGIVSFDPVVDRQRIAYMLQSHPLLPWRTASQNAAVPLLLRGTDRRAAESRAAEWLSLVGLSEHLDDFPYELSGGMKQRVALARCFSAEPQLILLDEPFANLDVPRRRMLGTLIRRTARQSGQGVIMVTHSVEDVLLGADRMVLLSARPARIRKRYAFSDAAVVEPTDSVIVRDDAFETILSALTDAGSRHVANAEQ